MTDVRNWDEREPGTRGPPPAPPLPAVHPPLRPESGTGSGAGSGTDNVVQIRRPEFGVTATAISHALSLAGADPAFSPVPAAARIEISLLGAFSVRVGGHDIGALSTGSQRLLAFLALHDRVVARVAMAGAMWPEASDRRAGVSLRSALSRLDVATREAIVVTGTGLRLADTVDVDLRHAQALAHRLLQLSDGSNGPDGPGGSGGSGGSGWQADLSPAAVAALSVELLPDWYDDWVLAEAEDWRLLRLHALEAQARLLTAGGRLARAAAAARAAIRVDPLRETAYANLVRVHLAEGNQSEALRVFNRYRELLLRELGLEPTPLLTGLVAGIRRC